MTIPTMGITWPSASASASTIITYSYADERFESYLSTQYGGYPELASTLTATQTLVSLYGTPKKPTSSTVQLTPDQTLIQKCYIAYYGCPADAEGLAYWSEQLDKSTGNLSAIINVFANSVEAQGLYGTLSTTQVVTKLYDQLFGRTPDAEGLQYWTTNIDNGSYTRHGVILNLLEGAQGSDLTIINNKFTAAGIFTHSFISGYGAEDLQDVKTWLSGITTSTPYQEAVTTAINAIGVNLPLTTSTSSIYAEGWIL